MTFILSKLLLFFLRPFLWVLALILIGMWVKKRNLKRVAFTAAAVVLILFSNPFLFNRVAAWWNYKRPPADLNKTYSCAIVLGGFVSEDSQGNGFFNSSSDRFIQGLRLHATRQASHLLITGGNASLIPDRFTEGGWVANELKAFGVPDSNILIEQHSRNTIENARFSKVLLTQAHLPPPYLLVTSAFHMRRALATFALEHIEVVPYACNFESGMSPVTIDDFIPRARVMDDWNTYFKEMIGVLLVR